MNFFPCIPSRRTFLAAALISASGMVHALPSVGSPNSAASGMLYIESNIGDLPGRNSILAYRRDGSGHLAPIGEYLTGGTGVSPVESTFFNLPTTLGPYDSDQNLILSADGTRLFAVNSGSDSIAVFDVRVDGSLSAVNGSPFPSYGVMPVSVGLSRGGDFLTVVNKDYDIHRAGFDVSKRAPNYTNFAVGPRGRLIHVPFSTIETGHGGGIGPGNTNPSQALIAPNGHFVFDADTFASAIVSLNVGPLGHLTRNDYQTTPASEFVPFPPIPNPNGKPFPLGLAAHPRERIFYAGYVLESTVGVYSYDAAGRVQFVRTAPAGFGVCWLAMNKAGTRLYTANTLANTVSVLDTTDPLNPVELQEYALPGPLSAPAQLALDTSGGYLYLLTQKALDVTPIEANAIAVLQLAADGTIATETDRLVIPVSPSIPQGVLAR